MPDTTLLKLTQIQKQLPSGFLLNNVNLELKSGEIHVIMGENGSGKSCLMQIVSGLLQADRGNLEVLGEQQSYSSVGEVAKKSVIYIQQNANILQNLSIAENIFYNQMPYKNHFLKIIDQNLLEKQCLDIINDLKLPFAYDDNVSQLGMAQKQILGFCRAYVSNAKIVILDEPSASLTEHDQKILHTIMEKIKARGAGILYISHNLNEIRQFGNRVSILNKGSLVGTLELDKHSDGDIIKLMSGAAIKNRYPRLKVNQGKEILNISHLNVKSILDDINFTLHKGEIIGITGLAGSGRTCLAHSLFGTMKIDQGLITIDGKQSEITSPYEAIAKGIALIPEDRINDSLVNCLDITKNVSLSSLHRFTRFLSINTTFLNQVVLDYFQKFNVESLGLSKNISDYSIGSQQKAVFAKWIMKRSKIFILDEPTRSLDIPSRIDIYNSMNDLVQKGAGILFISSDIEEILGMCDRVLVLYDGKIVCNLKSDEADKRTILAYATGENKSQNI